MKSLRIVIDSFKGTYSVSIDGRKMNFSEIAIVLQDGESNELLDEHVLVNGDARFYFAAPTAKKFSLDFRQGRNSGVYSTALKSCIRLALQILFPDGSVLLYLLDTTLEKKAVMLTANNAEEGKKLKRLFSIVSSIIRGGVGNVYAS